MIVWFTTIFILGLWRITLEPHILYAFNPWEAISYLIRERKRGFIQIGRRNPPCWAVNRTVLFFRRRISGSHWLGSTLCRLRWVR